MNKMNRLAILIFSLSLAVQSAGEVPLVVKKKKTTKKQEQELELVKSETMDVELHIGEQTDNSRIYLEDGAIWASRDINRIDPELKVTVNDEAVVEGGRLKEGMTFNVKTNYGYYIKKWELSIYRADDMRLQNPIETIEGTDFNNNLDVKWDGTSEDYKLRGGRQLLFRVKVWDELGNMDVTTTGVLDLVDRKSNFNLDTFATEIEDERTFGEASLMRHNIPVNSGMARFIGSNLQGVDKVRVGKEEYTVENNKLYAEEYLPTDRYFIPVTVIYEDGRELEYEVYVEIPEKYYIHTGLADMYIGKNYLSKNKEVLEVDDEYDGDIYNRGRLAYFGQGKFGDKLRLTAHMDTRESKVKDMFRDIYESDTSSVFERVEDDDRFYPTYGDDSYIERVVNTQGKLYLNLEYDKSDYLWGNYNTGLTATEFSQYNRSLYGAKADYRTRSTTSYGEDRLNVVGFAAEPETLSSHDEFLGTGGSLYFLKHGDVVEGSDKVAVKLVNKTTNITEDIIYLQEGRDYNIDNYQGRIILVRPLTDISSDSFGSIIKNNPRDGYENYLVADYEYIPDDSDKLDNMTFGGRAKGWLNDHIGVGGTYVSEEKDTYDYEMKGVDLTLRATEATYITTEFSTSEGTQVDSNFLSLDGGLNFDKIENTAREDKSGDAFRVAGVLSLYDINKELFSPYGNDVMFWYQDKDSEYSYASKDDDLAWENYGAEVRLRPTNRLQLKGRYSYTEEKDTLDNKVTDTEELQLQSEYAFTDKLTLGSEYKHIEELDGGEQGKGDLIGGKIEYEIVDGTKVYTMVQNTIHTSNGYEDNDLYTIGGETRINSKLRLSAEGSTGDRGHSADATLDYNVANNYDVYVGYVLEDQDDSDKNNIVFGQRASLNDRTDIYQENQFVDENNGKGRTDSYGIDYELRKDHNVGVAFQMGKLKKDDEEDTKRKAISIYQRVELGRTVVKNKVEYRQDKGSEDIHQYLTTNSFRHKLTEEYTVVGKLNYSRTDNDTTDTKEAEYTEANVGLAYRPIYNDKINYLTRYTYLQDEEKDSDRDIDYEDEKSHIFEFETLYAYNQFWDLGLKLAFKNKKETFERESGDDIKVRSKIYLVGVKATYHLMHNWDIFGEYHWKIDDYEDDLEQGAIVAINRHVGENFKIGIGYNFSKFDDDLRKDDYNAHGWFINVVGKF